MTEPARPALLQVQMEIAAEREEELNAWYWQEHLPERMAVPGFVSGRRFERVDGGTPKYLALYELLDVGVLDSAEYRRLVTPPDFRTKEIGRMLRANIRAVFVEMTPPKRQDHG